MKELNFSTEQKVKPKAKSNFVWFKNLTIFKIKNFELNKNQLEELLSLHELQHCEPNDMKRYGFVRQGEGMPFIQSSQGHMFLNVGTEKKILPASVINQFTAEKVKDIEEQQGYKVGRKQQKEIKEIVTSELKAKAFTIRSQVSIWIDTANGFLIVNSSSRNKAEDTLEFLYKIMPAGVFALELIKTKTESVSAMTMWLSGNEDFAISTQFTVDQSCELVENNERKPTIRYAKHSLDGKEIHEHIQHGKSVTKLALTWENQVSFVMSNDWVIKKVNALHSVKSQEEDSVDGEIFLMTSELSALIKGLIRELGGQVEEVKD